MIASKPKWYMSPGKRLIYIILYSILHFISILADKRHIDSAYMYHFWSNLIDSATSGSGPEYLLQCCYRPIAVQVMMTGKAVSLIVQRYVLIASVLNMMFFFSNSLIAVYLFYNDLIQWSYQIILSKPKSSSGCIHYMSWWLILL